MLVYGVIVYLGYFAVCFRHMSYLVSRTPDLLCCYWSNENHKRV